MSYQEISGDIFELVSQFLDKSSDLGYRNCLHTGLEIIF